jgi:hypothetical protein
MSRVRFPMSFLNSPNPSSRITALGSTQPLTEMSTRNLPGGKWRPARKADNLTAICEPTVWKMWEPRRLTILWASTTCYRDSFTFIYIGRGVAQAVSRRLPSAMARVRVRADMWGLWWTKRHWGRFSPSTSASLANHHSTNFSIIIISRGWHIRPIGGRSAEWTQLDSNPHYTNFNLFIYQ